MGTEAEEAARGGASALEWSEISGLCASSAVGVVVLPEGFDRAAGFALDAAGLLVAGGTFLG